MVPDVLFVRFLSSVVYVIIDRYRYYTLTGVTDFQEEKIWFASA